MCAREAHCFNMVWTGWRYFESATTTNLPFKEPTNRQAHMQSISKQLRPREPSIGVNYAACQLTVNHHQPSAISDQRSGISEISVIKFTKRTVSTAKQQNAFASNFIPKTAFRYLNIFRAKTKGRMKTNQSLITACHHPLLIHTKQ
jgi:hypothetical protein